MKNLRFYVISIFCFAAIASECGASNSDTNSMDYSAKWESLDSRPCPTWYANAKFGIFIHWGVYSVPSWSPKGGYAEWYRYVMEDKNSSIREFHTRMFGKDFEYEDFAKQFKAELFNPDEWAKIFKRSGAKYVVLTSKHHEGYCLWPSELRPNWNVMDVGPKRDLLGELTGAVRSQGIKMGYYYSLYEWNYPLYKQDINAYVSDYMLPQLKDLVVRYQPSLVFADGEWDHPSSVWKSEEFLAWLFNESPVRQEVVVNDRWGKECRSRHGGYFTTEYGKVDGNQTELNAGKPWEECRGIGSSFGYNRNESIDDYQSSQALIHMLIDIVSKGGNLLLNIGPTADGRIPVVMQQRLVDIGQWLEVNGEAIYSSNLSSENQQEKNIRFTEKKDYLYAICFEWPGKELKLNKRICRNNLIVNLLGTNFQLPWSSDADGGIIIDLSSITPDKLPCHYAYTFRLTKHGH